MRLTKTKNKIKTILKNNYRKHYSVSQMMKEINISRDIVRYALFFLEIEDENIHRVRKNVLPHQGNSHFAYYYKDGDKSYDEKKVCKKCDYEMELVGILSSNKKLYCCRKCNITREI